MPERVAVFGQTVDGRKVHAVRLRCGQLAATVLTLGATLQDVRLAGTPWPLTLGANSVAAYEGPCRWFGSIVGPVANRIEGARANIDGRLCKFDANEAGRTTLHSGASGTDAQLWSIAAVDETSVTLTLTLPDGMGGFPGTRQITAHFKLSAPATLTLTLAAETDAPSLMNLANHSYWNLDGADTTAGHQLQVMADHYLPTDDLGIPLAQTPVADTLFDLRQPALLSRDRPIDHNFCLASADRQLQDVAILYGSRGVSMTVATTAPGLQIYDGAWINSHPFPGLMGQVYGARAGVAIEAQHWPNAPHRPDFPSVSLLPGRTYHQQTRWRFSRSESA